MKNATEPAACEPPDRSPQKPQFEIPAGAVDCHAHIFDPLGLSEIDQQRIYSPSVATLEQFNQLHKKLGITYGVIVQPSVYGTDNRTTLAAVAESGDRFRAVVVVDQDVSVAQLHDFHLAGARGVRVNMLFASSAQLDNLKQLARTIQSLDHGWHIQLLTDISSHLDLESLVTALEVPIVFDHFGHMPLATGMKHSGFQSMLKLLAEGRCWVKLSAPYRITACKNLPYTDVTDFAQALLKANPQQLIWGSDWPHPHFNGVMPNDGHLLDELKRWIPQTELRNRILVDNAHKLYGFN